MNQSPPEIIAKGPLNHRSKMPARDVPGKQNCARFSTEQANPRKCCGRHSPGRNIGELRHRVVIVSSIDLGALNCKSLLKPSGNVQTVTRPCGPHDQKIGESERKPHNPYIQPYIQHEGIDPRFQLQWGYILMFRGCSVTRSRHIADKRLPRPPHATPKIKTSTTSNEEYGFKRAVTPKITANKKLRTSIVAANRKISFDVIKTRSGSVADESVRKRSHFSTRTIRRLLTHDTTRRPWYCCKPLRRDTLFAFLADSKSAMINAPQSSPRVP